MSRHEPYPPPEVVEMLNRIDCGMVDDYDPDQAHEQHLERKFEDDPPEHPDFLAWEIECEDRRTREMGSPLITGTAEYSRLPDYADPPNITGMTLRQALRALREVNWGDLGRMDPVTMSDGSELGVRNAPSYDGGILLGVHRAEREWHDYDFAEHLRTYPI